MTVGNVIAEVGVVVPLLVDKPAESRSLVCRGIGSPFARARNDCDDAVVTADAFCIVGISPASLTQKVISENPIAAAMMQRIPLV